MLSYLPISILASLHVYTCTHHNMMEHTQLSLAGNSNMFICILAMGVGRDILARSISRGSSASQSICDALIHLHTTQLVNHNINKHPFLTKLIPVCSVIPNFIHNMLSSLDRSRSLSESPSSSCSFSLQIGLLARAHARLNINDPLAWALSAPCIIPIRLVVLVQARAGVLDVSMNYFKHEHKDDMSWW